MGEKLSARVETRVLVLGASGMLGNAVLRVFVRSNGYQTFATVRNERSARLLPEELRSCIVSGVDVENNDSLVRVFTQVRPDVVINCIGLVKQLAQADDPLVVIPVNSLLPHRLAGLSALVGARLIHLSTDCVFSGSRGMYLETDSPDAEDLYGKSKLLGEVDYPHAITLRTSIIGHELDDARSLIGWFLAQQGAVNGFRNAVFSGLPTVEIARLIREHVLPNPKLHGVYHVSADPISKYELLMLVKEIYGKDIDIQPEDQFVIDRSLNSARFRAATGFKPKPWPELVRAMREFG